MTRLFTDGAEMGDIQFWDWSYPGFGVTCVATPDPIGGDFCYQGCWLGAYKLIGSSLNEFYMRYRLRTSNTTQIHPGFYVASILGWRNGNTGLGDFTLDALKRFAVYIDGTGHYESAPIVMQDNVWYLIELHVVLDGVVGRIEVYIDGVQYIDYTGNTGNTTIDNIFFNTSAYTAVFIDDLALNDTNGIVDNSWCGDGIIVKMTPNDNGDENDWTNSNGDNVNNYLYVDEYPNDGDLTYVYCDGSSSGTQDKYNVTDLDYTNKTVLRIYPEARARKTSSSAYTLKLGILPSGGADNVSAGRNLFSDYYARIIGNEYLVNPFDGNPWDELSLDPIQFIAEVG